MVHLIWSHIPSTLTLLPEQSQARWGFILVGTNSLDIAKASFDEGLDLMAAGNLRPSHENAWKELWLQSKVEVTGSETLSKAVIGCMFYLLSAFPSIHDTSSSFGGVSPGGLSNGGDGQDYWGHVFWDQVWLDMLFACCLFGLYDASHSNPTFLLIGPLDVSWYSPFLSQASPSSARVQGGDYRWCKGQRTKAGPQGMMIRGMKVHKTKNKNWSF